MNVILGGTTPGGSGFRITRLRENGRKVDTPFVGSLALLSRESTGSRIGVVRGTDSEGNPIVLSGNFGEKVIERVYRKEWVRGYFVVETCGNSAAR